MTPPAVQKEAEEEWVDASGVEMMGMNVKSPISLEGGCWSPQSSV